MEKRVKLCKHDPKLLRGGMMELYKMMGIIHNESSTNVESRIRAAIEKTFEQGNTELLYEMFGSFINQDKAKPANIYSAIIHNDFWVISRVRML